MRICATCSQSPEARPGVRLCRSCIEVAWTVAEAIHEEERAAAARPSERFPGKLLPDPSESA